MESVACQIDSRLTYEEALLIVSCRISCIVVAFWQINQAGTTAPIIK